MIDNVLTYLKEGNVFSGIEISDNSVGKCYFFLEVIKKKGELLISKKEKFQALNEISELYKKRSPVVITINTKDVLTKIVDASYNSNPEALVEKAFPNFNFEDFYYELTPFNERTLVSIIKKENVASLIKEITSNDITIVDFSLAISFLRCLKEYMHWDKIRLHSDEILFDKSGIKEIGNSFSNDFERPMVYEINGIEIENRFLLCFAGIFGFVSKNKASFYNYTLLKDSFEKKYYSTRFFNLVSKSALTFFLGLLLLNFLFFNYYFQQVEGLQSATEINSLNKKKLSELTNRVLEKERRVDAILLSGNSKSTYYLDALGKSIPLSILINQIEYQPLLKPIREDKFIAVQKHVITISGNSTDNTEFSRWIKKIEDEVWVKKVVTSDFAFESKISSLFTVKIVLNE